MQPVWAWRNITSDPGTTRYTQSHGIIFFWHHGTWWQEKTQLSGFEGLRAGLRQRNSRETQASTAKSDCPTHPSLEKAPIPALIQRIRYRHTDQRMPDLHPRWSSVSWSIWTSIHWPTAVGTRRSPALPSPLASVSTSSPAAVLSWWAGFARPSLHHHSERDLEVRALKAGSVRNTGGLCINSASLMQLPPGGSRLPVFHRTGHLISTYPGKAWCLQGAAEGQWQTERQRKSDLLWTPHFDVE